MGDGVFDFFRKFRDCFVGIFIGDEHRIVAETAAAGLLEGDLPFHYAFEEMFLSANNESDDTAEARGAGHGSHGGGIRSASGERRRPARSGI